MQETETVEEPQKRKRPWKTILVCVGLLFLAVWFLTPTGAIDRPVRMERDEDGQLRQVDQKDAQANNFVVNANAGVVKANSSTSTVSSTSHSDPGWFQAKKLIVMNRSDHLLLDRVGQSMLKELNDSPHWQSVTYLPHDSDMKKELDASDVYMTIDLKSIKESGIVGRELDVVVITTLGTSLINSHHSVHDSLSPPTVRFHAKISLEHHSTLTGVESAGAKYSLQAQKIAEDLVAALNGQIDGLKEKNSPHPQEIKKLLAEYRSAPEFDFLGEKQLVASTHGIMVHNETLWMLDKVADSKALLETVSNELKKLGWKEYSKQLNENFEYLRMKDESQWLEVFQEEIVFRKPGEEGRDQPRQWYVRYVDRMSAADLEKIYASFLSSDEPDIELLLALDRLANREQRDQLLKFAESHPPASVHGWLRLAGWYAARKEQDQLINALKRATLASLLSKDRNDSSREIKNFIKKYKLDEEKVTAVDVELLEAAGIQGLSSENPTAVQKFELGTPVAFYISGNNPAEWKYASATVEPAEADRFRLSYFQGDQKSSHGSSSMCCIDLERKSKQSINVDEAEIEIEIRKIDATHFEATASLQ